MRAPQHRLRRVVVLFLTGVIASLSCGREITGPEGRLVARGFTFDVRFAPLGGPLGVASDLVPFTHVRVLLRNAQGAIAVDRVIEFPSTAEEVDVSLTVPLSFNASPTGEAMQLALAFANAQGDTVFRAGPTDVLIVPTGSSTPQPEPPILEPEYVGPGAGAQSVVISPDGASVMAGDPFAFTAVAFDAQGQPLANAPVGWYSLDPLIAPITDEAAGAGVTLPSRGTARIVAQVIGGFADTAVLNVAPKLGSLVKVSGDAQSATAGTTLPQGVVVRVVATDGQPLEGVNVLFEAQNGGSAGVSGATSDAAGLVQTTWTLGLGGGAQSLTATVAGPPTMTATFTANASAPVAQVIHYFPMNGNVNDAVGTAHGTLIGGASVANGALTLDGETGYAELPIHAIPTSGSYTVALFVRNRTSLSLGAEYISQGATSTALFIGHDPSGSLHAGDDWLNTGFSAPAIEGTYHHFALVVDVAANQTRFYVDGVLRAQRAGLLAHAPTGSPTRFGRQHSANLGYLDGEIDDVVIYTGVVSDATILAAANAGPTTDGRLVFQQQPTGALAGAAIAPAVTVRVENAMGQLKTTFSGNVTIGFGANPGGATLGGTTTVAAVGGIATFGNLSVSNVGSGYTLLASASGHEAATSAPFGIVAGGGGTISWTNPSGGNWSVAANWSENRVPNATDAIEVTLAGTYTVTLDANFSGAELILGGVSGTQTLAIPAARTLTIGGDLLVNPSGSLVATGSGSAVAGGGLLSNYGSTTVATGASLTIASVANAGLLVMGGNASVTGSFGNNAGGTLRVLGSAGLGGGVNASFANSFSNFGAIELTTQDAGYTVSLAVAGTLVNTSSGTFSTLTGSGGARTLAAQLDNQGTVTLNAAMTLNRAESDHVNGGTIALVGGNLTVTQTGSTPSFTNTGAVDVGSGRTFNTSAGTLDLSAGLVSGVSGYLTTTGAAVVRFSTATVQPRINFSAATTVPDPFVIPEGDSLRVVDGTFAPTSLVVDGTLFLEGNATVNTPSLTNNSLIQVRGLTVSGGAAATITNGFVNTGTIELTTANAGYTMSLSVPNGTLVNDADGTILISLGAGGARTLAAQLDNQGTLTLNTAMTLNRAEADHLNSGTITVTGGNFTVTQTGSTPSFTNTGTVDVGSGRTFNTSAGTLDLSAGLISGVDGYLTTSGATVVRFTTATVQPRINFSAATTVPDPFVIPEGDSLRVVDGTFAPVSLVVDGTLFLEGNATVNTPSLTNNSLIQVRGLTVSGGAAATITNGFVNTSLIELTTANAGYTMSLTVPNGTLVNDADGTILISLGAGGARTLAAQLDNQGTVTLNTALTLNRAEADHVNSGTIAVTGGNLTVTQTGSSPSFTNVGVINVDPSRTMHVSNGMLDLIEGSMVGVNGYLTTAGAAVVRFSTATVQPRINFSAATTVPDPFVIPEGDSLRVVDGTFAPISLVVDGTLFLEGNATVNTPSLTNNSLIQVRGLTVSGGAAATITNGFVNTSTIELTTFNAGYTMSLTVPNGTLVNDADGTILISLGAGGARTLAAQLDNQGTLTLNTALTLNRAEADHVNSGTITVTGGNFTVTQTGTSPSFTNIGLISIDPSRTMNISNGTLDLIEGNVVGVNGYLTTTGSPIVRLQTPNLQPRINFSAGTSVPDPFVIPEGDSLRVVDGTFAPPSLVVNGTLFLEGNATVNTPSLTNNSLIQVRGLTVSGGASATITNGFTNTGVIEITTFNAGYTMSLSVPNGTLVNDADGTILISLGAGGARTLAAQLDNQGTLTLNTALTLNRAEADHVNSGTIALVGGNLTVTQTGSTPSFTNTGTVDVGSGRTFNTSAGSLDLSAGLVSGVGGYLTTTGATVVRFSTATVHPRINFSAATTVPDPFTVPTGDSLRVVDGTFAPTSLVVDGTLFLEGNATVNTPSLTNNSLIQVRGLTVSGGAAATITNGFVNTGTIEITTFNAGYTMSLTVPNGTLVNDADGTILISSGAGGARTLAAQLDNQGTLTLNTALTLNRAEADHLNSGTIAVTGGNLTVTQTGSSPSFTNTGTVDVGSGRTFSSGGGSLNLTNGLVSGVDGYLTTTGAAVVRFSTATVQPRINFSAATTVPDPFTIPVGDSLRVVDGTFAPTSLVVGGTLFLEGNATVNTPSLTNNSLIQVRGLTVSGGAAATITNGFTNTGTIEITTFNAGYTMSLTVPSGTLVNSPAGTILISSGAGGARTLAAQLDNQGTLTLNTALTLNRAEADHVNSGTIAVTGGNLTVTQTGSSPSFTNTGTVALAASRSLSVGNGLLDLQAGTVTGPDAYLVTTGSPMVRFTTATVEPRIQFAAGTVVPDAFTIPVGDSLRVGNGTFAPPSLTVNGTLLLEGSAVLTTPALTNNSMIRVRGSAAGGGGVSATITNGFTNTGTIEMTTENAGYTVSLSIPGGTLTNAATGTIASLLGTSGARTITAAMIDNSGTVTIGINTTINAAVQQRGQLDVALLRTLTISGLLTLQPGSTSTVLGVLLPNGGCSNLGGLLSGFLCP